MNKQSITEISHLYLKNIIEPTDIIIDATMGHGFDTVFMAKYAKHVFAFDIQQQALDATNLKIKDEKINNVTTILDSHLNFDQYVKSFQGVIFNLGYLPQGDKTITTKAETTLLTIQKMLIELSSKGFMMLVVYMGHPEGYQEHETISNFMKTLDPKQFKIIKTDLPYQDNYPPYILWITKL